MKKRGRKPSGHGQKYDRGYQCGFQRVRREVVDGRKPRPHNDSNKTKEERNGIRDGKKAAKKTYKK